MSQAPEQLKFENQLCFPVYAAANAVVRAYRPFLKAIDLTYLQYMVLMLLWERKSMSVKEIGELMYLDSGTLTPLLKRLAEKQFITRTRSAEDERVRVIQITEKGELLKQQAESIPQQAACSFGIERKEAEALKDLCNSILRNIPEP